MSKPRSDKPPDNTTDAPPPPRFWEHAIRPRHLLGCALFAVAAVLTPWLIRQLPDLQQRPEYRLPFAQIQLEPVPSGSVPADLPSRVQRRSGMPETLSLLDPKLPEKVAQAFAAHPWIEQVVEVRNVYPAQVKVRVKYRQAVAVVLVKSGLYPVDGQAVLLPPSDFDADDVESLIPIRGVLTTPYAEEGRTWNDPAVMAAADLARYLQPLWHDLQLSAIVVARPESADAQPDDISLELETAGGSRILWGRRPASRHPGELTGEQKLGRLKRYLAEFASYVHPAGPYEIDIRHWEEISRRPLGGERLPTNTAAQRTSRRR